MPALSRRSFTALAGASLAAVPILAPRALGQAKPKVVVVGGGPGGALTISDSTGMLSGSSESISSGGSLLLSPSSSRIDSRSCSS